MTANTSSFDSATPAHKARLLLESYRYLGTRMELMAVEMKVTNDWIRRLPGLIAAGQAEVPADLESWFNLLEGGADRLVDQIVLNTTLTETLMDAIKQFKAELVEKQKLYAQMSGDGVTSKETLEKVSEEIGRLNAKIYAHSIKTRQNGH